MAKYQIVIVEVKKTVNKSFDLEIVKKLDDYKFNSLQEVCKFWEKMSYIYSIDWSSGYYRKYRCNELKYHVINIKDDTFVAYNRCQLKGYNAMNDPQLFGSINELKKQYPLPS